MLATVLHGPDDIRYEECPTPEPGPGEVLVQVRAVGVCGSDVPRVLADAAHFYPLILGHEFAGVIAGFGEGVRARPVGRGEAEVRAHSGGTGDTGQTGAGDTSLRAGAGAAGVGARPVGAAVASAGSDSRWTLGDRVTVAPLVPCHACEQCQRGHYSMCTHYSFIGSSRMGALAQYVAVPARNLVPLADSIDFPQAAMIEPSTVALHGIRVGDFRPGGHVAILGGGTVGLLTAQWARILGAKSVTVVDVDPHRLSVARDLGVSHTIDSRLTDPVEAARQLTEGEGFSHVFETAGQVATQNLALRLVARAGAITLIGNAHDDPHFPAATFELLNRREVHLTASWMSYSAPFPGVEWTDTVHYFASGALRWSPALLQDGHALPLSAVGGAFQLYRRPGAINGKLLFRPEA